MHNAKLVHVRQTLYDVDELGKRQSLRYQDDISTHEVNTVCIRLVFDEFTNRPITRPVRNQPTPT